MMKCQMNVLGVTLSILLIGCAASVPAQVPEGAPLKSSEQLPPPPLVSSPTNTGQMLPISAQAEMAGQRIMLEVAQTPEQQAMGLMYRTSLEPNRGMLFPFNPPQSVSFWMENTIIPLDMVFLSQGEVKAIAADVPPCTTNPCPIYGPKVPIDQVIELRGGRAAQLGLKPGDRVTIKFLSENAVPPHSPSS